MEGTTVSHYRVQQRLGAGGMGVVYRAEDTRLRRAVALKFLPDAPFTSEPARERFHREARAASALNHPHICTIHDIGEHEGRPFLVMELLEGTTLKQLIATRRLPIAQVLDLGVQIADALDAAHRRGIVHRDIKPSNVFVTTSGQAKVLDFGLAKMTAARAPTADGQGPDDPTITVDDDLTGRDVAVGTVAYMSPEQALGDEVDHRSDLFSVGLVLYEMATGRQAFTGTSTGVAYGIVHEAPVPAGEVAPALPGELSRILDKLLEKDRELRYQDASDLRADLKRLQRDTAPHDAGRARGHDSVALAPATGPTVSPPAPSSSSSHVAPVSTAPAPASPRARVRRVLAAAMGLLVLIGVIALAYVFRPVVPPPRITGTTEVTRVAGDMGGEILTDGARVYYAQHSTEGGFFLSQVAAGGGEPARIDTPELGNIFPTGMAADGSALLATAVLHGEEFDRFHSMPLWVLPLPNGAPRRLGDVQARSAAWSPDGQRLAYSAGRDVFVAGREGTEPTKVLSLPRRAFWLRWSRDGQRLRFASFVDSDGRFSWWDVRPDGTDLQRVLTAWPPPGRSDWFGSPGDWTKDGRYFVFVSNGGRANGRIWALREEQGRFEQTTRDPVELAAGPINYMGVRPSPDGRRLIAVGEQRRGELVRLERGTSDARAYMGGLSAEMLAFSADERWVAYVSFPDGTLWRSGVNGEERLQLTHSPASAVNPRWSPDGRRILFFGKREPRERTWIFTVSRDGGAMQPAAPATAVGTRIALSDPTWSPDGRAIAFGTSGPDGDQDIRIVDVQSGRVDHLPGSEGLFSPRWAPSGRYIAAMKGGAYLAVYDVETKHWMQLYDHDVDFPVWAPDSLSLYFRRYATGKGQDSDVYRVWISDHRVERIWRAQGFVFEQSVGSPWLGLAPDGSLLSMRSATTRAIYAFDWEAP